MKLLKHSAIDFSVGSPIKRILAFMLPMFIGIVFQQLYSMADTAIVGQTLGSDALAGVGSTGSISFLIMGFVSGLTGGFSVVTSQKRGARDDEGLRRSFITGIILTVVILSVLTVVSLFVAKPLLVAMHTLPEAMPYAHEYITTVFAGMMLSAFYNEFSSALRAIGDSVMPLFFLIFSCFVNIGLDFLFILTFDMGVRGAALATLISQGLSAALTLVYLWIKYPVFRFSIKDFRPDLKTAAAQLKLGIPMALQMSIISIGMIFGQTALNSMDNVNMNAAYVAASKIDGTACGAINSLGSATATFIGQNYGAKKFDRIKLGLRQLLLFALPMSVALGGIVIALHRPFIDLFIAKEDLVPEMYDYALIYLVFNGGFYALLASLCIFRGALQGMGRGTLTLFSAAAEVVMRVSVSIIAINAHSFLIVCMCNAASWLGANFILIPAALSVISKYVSIMKKNIKRVRLPNPSLPQSAYGDKKRRRF